MKKCFSIFSLLLISYFLIPFSTNAQGVLGTGTKVGRLEKELNVNVNPEHPQPLQTVSVSLEMYTEDLNSSDISYYVNNNLIKRGKGVKSFSFLMGPVGSPTYIDIAVILQNGTSFTKRVILTGAGVDLLWQADSYSHPFYMGKSLFAQQSRARVVAMPYFNQSISSINGGSNLIYTWSINGEVSQGISGYGKNAIYVNGSVFGKATQVEVTVSDPNTGVTADGSLTLVPKNPEILFYEDHPLYGPIFDRAILGKTTMVNDEMSILATPYNMSKSAMNNFKYVWKINGIDTEDIAGREALFRKPGGTGGESNVSLEISNPVEYLQYGKNSFVIKFDKENEITSTSN